MIVEEKCPKKLHDFLGVWLLHTFLLIIVFHKSITLKNLTEDPIPGILRFSWTVNLQPLNVASMELYIQKNTFGFVQKYQHLQNLQGLGRVKTLPYGNDVTTLQTEICIVLTCLGTEAGEAAQIGVRKEFCGLHPHQEIGNGGKLDTENLFCQIGCFLQQGTV